MNYYNDNSREACAWLRELIAEKIIPNGIVDERSISEVSANDVSEFVQCHFFAGIGGWPYALLLAGWPEDRIVWTGSCPCQPLSCAGKRCGEKDERHLWPEFYRLIAECRPATVFGEQVASKDGLEWLDGISLDLEELGYAVGSSDLPAACVGAPHIRQRAYWVAQSNFRGCGARSREGSEAEESKGRNGQLERRGEPDWVVFANGSGRYTWEPSTTIARHGCSTEPASGIGRMGNSQSGGCGISRDASHREQGGHVERAEWSRFELIKCRDGKTRRIPTEPAFFPLVNGLQPGRVGLLRGAGNAIVPQVAALFVKAFLEIE